MSMSAFLSELKIEDKSSCSGEFKYKPTPFAKIQYSNLPLFQLWQNAYFFLPGTWKMHID